MAVDRLSKFISDLADRAKSAATALKPLRTAQEINGAVGARTAILKNNKGFGGFATTLTSISEPRKQYNFLLSISLGGNAFGVEANIKSIERPKLSFDYRETRYLNTVKKTLKSIEYDPITIVIYDDLAGKVQTELQQFLKSKYISTIEEHLHLGSSVNLKSFNDTIIPEIIIHSGTSPVSNILGVGVDVVGGAGKEVLTGSKADNMILSQCTINSIDFGDFDYTSSEVNLITLVVSYQSLSFGNTDIADAALSVFGGLGGKVLSGQL